VTWDAVVIGAGPAGLATSRELERRGVEHVVLERGDRIGYAWTRLYDSLVLHTGKHLSALPGMRFPAATALYPSRAEFVGYLDRYATTFHLPVRTGAEVTRAGREGRVWRLETRAGEMFRARTAIVATGIMTNPSMPSIPHRQRFQGRVRHSIDYRNPADLAGRRVLVAGAGNSAGDIAAELAGAGAEVTIAVRSGAHIVPRDVLGIPIQYVSITFGYLPRALQRGVATLLGRAVAAFRGKPLLPPPHPGGCAKVPLVGFHLADAIRRGAIRVQPSGIASFTETGVRFDDGTSLAVDEVILATGFRAALGMFDGAVRTDPCGFGMRRRRVESVDHPNLYFVGHNPDVRGGIFSIGRDARRVARLLTQPS
jgi:cation diffusion facilitator CzcD-associated flavoprotein CzcO